MKVVHNKSKEVKNIEAPVAEQVVEEVSEQVVEEVSEQVAPQEESVVLSLPLDEANNYIAIIGVIMVGDDRMKSLQTHFIDMIKRHNEENTKQSN